MTEYGPLQVRRDNRENLSAISPAEGEMLISTDEPHEGQVHVGLSGGGPSGGVRIGLTSQDKANLRGTPNFHRDVDQTSHVMALNNEWQVDGGGWDIPSRVAGEVKHWPIVQGKLPARAINTGGWIDFHMDGVYRRPDVSPGTQDSLFIRLMVGDTYIGPDAWAFSEVGWGWAGQGEGLGSWDQTGGTITVTGGDDLDAPDGANELHLRGDSGNDCDVYFEFNLRMRCISGKGVQIVSGREVPTDLMWKLNGDFEVWAGEYNALQNPEHSTNQTYVPASVTGFERHTKLIREFANAPDVNVTNVFRLEIGSPRSNSVSSFTPSDSIVVHNASMIAQGITRGRQVYRSDLGAYMNGGA